MSRPLASPKHYVLIDDDGAASAWSWRGQRRSDWQVAASYATVEALEPRLRSLERAGHIIPPITRKTTNKAESTGSAAPSAAAGQSPQAVSRAGHSSVRRFMPLIVLAVLIAGAAVWAMLAQPWKEKGGSPSLDAQGDSLTLPVNCLLSRLGMAGDVPFVRFDDQYPEQWPAGLKLPFGYFNQGQGKLAVIPARPGDVHYKDVYMIPFKGLVHNTPQEVIAYFKKSAEGAGLKVTNERRVEPRDIGDLGTDPGRYTVSARPEGKVLYPMFYVSVALMEDMGGWTYLSGYWIYGQYQVMEGEKGRGIPPDAKIVKDYDSGEEVDPNDPNAQPVQNESGRQPVQPHDETEGEDN